MCLTFSGCTMDFIDSPQKSSQKKKINAKVELKREIHDAKLPTLKSRCFIQE